MTIFDLQLIREAPPAIIVVVAVSIVLLLAFSGFLLLRYLTQRRLRIFLHRTLPCSHEQSRFSRSKSLFDILLDIGLSMESLDLISGRLDWIASIHTLDHRLLNDRVSGTVNLYGTYASFVTKIKAELQGQPNGGQNNLSERSWWSKIKAKLTGDSSKQPPNVESLKIASTINSMEESEEQLLERTVEQRHIFNAMFIALRDETKTAMARRLGIAHRFDYLTNEMFQVVGRSEDRHIVACIDYSTKNLSADLLVSLGTVSSIAGGSMWALGSVAEGLGGHGVIESVEVAGGAETVGLAELGEAVLVLGMISLTIGAAKKIGKWLRELSLRTYQAEFKCQMEALNEIFFANGEEAAFRVPRLVIYALELEDEHLSDLLSQLRDRRPVDTSSAYMNRFALAVATEAYTLNRKMQQKFQGEIKRLIENVRNFSRNGRSDLAGLHLYINKDVVFLPSQLPHKQLKQIRETQIKLLREVSQLSKRG